MKRQWRVLIGAAIAAAGLSAAAATVAAQPTSADEAQARMRKVMNVPAVRAFLAAPGTVADGTDGDVAYTYPGSDGGGRGPQGRT